MRTTIAPIALLLAAAAALAFALPGSAQGTVYEHHLQVHEFEGGGMHVSPEQINANQGDTLKFIITNPEENRVSHNIVMCERDPAESGPCPVDKRWGFSPMIPPGETREMTFVAQAAGTYEYFCEVVGHETAPPGMAGVLNVKSTGGGGENESPSLAALGSLVALAGVALALRRR